VCTGTLCPKNTLSNLGEWIFKGAILVILWFAKDSFTEMKGDVKDMAKDLNKVSEVVIRLDEKVERDRESIDRLERTKQDKR